LRVWERRYKISPPLGEQESQRLYSKSDIDRLTLLKRLVDLGQPIGALSKLSLDSLRSMQDTLLGLGHDSSLDREIRLVIFGNLIDPVSLTEELSGKRVSIVFQAPHLNEIQSMQSDCQADLLLVDMPTLVDLQRELLDAAAQRCRAKRVVLFYRFAPSNLIRQLRHAGYSVLRNPIDAMSIANLYASMVRPHGSTGPFSSMGRIDRLGQSVNAEMSVTDEIQPRRYSDGTLHRLAQMKSSVYCECPSQLAELLMHLTGFEQYSSECANKTPDDALIHQALQRSAANARVILEQAMTQLLAAENLTEQLSDDLMNPPPARGIGRTSEEP
jgi:DNA-binding transcriptional MerR regulator